MDRIETMILNPSAVNEAKDMMVCAARLTQRGHTIKNMQDFINLYEKNYSEDTVKAMSSLPHPTIQKFGIINVVVVGASRRFLAQITRHQNEVKFMSASLQYSDYSGEADFVVPYELLDSQIRVSYLAQCREAMRKYQTLVDYDVNNDSAGYVAPQSLRNILIISATPYQWKHMIGQRVCRRNTDETRYVLLRIWEQLYKLSPEMFGNCGPFCMKTRCAEGKMTCGEPIDKAWPPSEIIKADFPLLYEEEIIDGASEEMR